MKKKILLSLALISTLSAVDKFKAGDIISADVMNEAFESITKEPTTADLVGSWSCKAITDINTTNTTASWTNHPEGFYKYLDDARLEIIDDNDGTYSFQTSSPNMFYAGTDDALNGSILAEQKFLYINITSAIDEESKRKQHYSIVLNSVNEFFLGNTGTPGSGANNLTSAKCERLNAIPKSPQELTVTVSGNTNTLKWKDLSTSETEFNILRKDSIDGDWHIVNTVNQNTTLYEDDVTDTKPYWYRVQAKNSTGTSLGSNVATTVINGTVTLTSTDVNTAINNAVTNAISNRSTTTTATDSEPTTTCCVTPVPASASSTTASADIQIVSTDANTSINDTTIQLTDTEITSLQNAISADTSTDYNITFANNTITVHGVDTADYNRTVISLDFITYDNGSAHPVSGTDISSSPSSYQDLTITNSSHTINISDRKSLIISVKSQMIPTQHTVTNTTELRAALLSAAQNGKSDIINLTDGTYKTTDDGLGTFTFLDNESYPLTLKGSSGAKIILSGDNTNQVLNHKAAGTVSLLKLSNISIVDGNSTSDTGGVYTSEKVIVTDSLFKHNSGNGLFTSNDATITDSQFTNNGGDGLYASSIDNIYNSQFTNNGRYGLRIGDYGNYYYTYIDNSTFSNNKQSGLYVDYKSIGINNSLFSANEGGGAYLSNGTITNSIFKDNNTSGTNGAGLHTDSSVTVINSIFENNHVTSNYDSEGGAIYARGLTMANTLIKNNSADKGSGVYINYNETNKITNSIFIDNNSTDVAGGSDAIVGLYNNYIDITNIDITSFKKNNIFSNTTLGFSNADNGDYHLTAGSSLINAGTSTIDGITLPETDLDGKPRVVGSSVDIGPYEYQQ